MSNNNSDSKTTLSSEKILDFITKNKNSLLGGLFAIVVLLIGYGIMNNMKAEANKEAANAFYKIQKQYDNLVKPDKEPEVAAEGEAPQTPELKKLTEEQANNLLNQFNQAFEMHKDSPQTGFALIDMVFILKDNGFQEKAIDLAESKIETLEKDSLAYAMGLIQLGSLQMEANNYDKAIESFSKIESLEQASFLKGEAMIKKGLCYQALDKIDEAKSVFTQASQEYPDSEYGESAKKYLKVLLINN